MFNNLKYLVREGLRNAWANRLMTLASVGVLVCCLVLMGSAVLVSVNITNIMELFEDQNVVMVFLNDTVSGSDKSLTVADVQQQIVEIVRAVSYDSKIIIMDEPTASLTQSEIDHLFEIIRNLKKKGVSIIYISHRFEELKEIGDRLTVLRDGCYVGTMDMADFTYDKAISMMVGRRLSQMYTTKHIPQTEELLRVEGLKISPRTEPVSFHVNRGEVVGIGGLVGAGRTELAQSIFGARKFYGGRIIYAGEEIHHPTPKALIEKGLMYLTEDRKSEGLILPKSIAQNITLPSLIPMITVMLLLSVGNVMRSDTGLFYQVTRDSGQLYSTTQVIDSYVLHAIFKNSNFGFTAATSFFQSVVGLLLMLFANWMVKKIEPENALF